MKKAICTLLAALSSLALGSCSDLKSPSSSSFIVRGTAATGAHTRTAISGGHVGVLIPAASGWTALSFAAGSGIPNKTITNDDGTFTFRIDTALLTATTGYPAFIAVSDAAQTFTMLSQIPKDLGIESAQLIIDLNPTTTAASLLICPGGKYPPPSGAYCYSDPNGNVSGYNSSLIGEIEISLVGPNISLETTYPPVWGTFISTLLADATTFNNLNTIVAAAGLSSGSFTASAIPTTVTANALPKVSKPIYGIDDNKPVEESDDSSGGSCVANWSCGSSSQCAQIMGGASGAKSGFDDATECQAWCTQYIPGNCSCSGC